MAAAVGLRVLPAVAAARRSGTELGLRLGRAFLADVQATEAYVCTS